MGSNAEPQQAAIPPAPTKKGMPSGFIIAIIGAIMMIAGLVLPWATATYTDPYTNTSISNSVTGMNIFGIIIALMGIMALIGALLKKGIMTAVFGIIGLLLSLLPLAVIGWLVETYKTAADLAGATDYSANIGLGIILCFVGSIMAVAGGFMGKSQKKKIA